MKRRLPRAAALVLAMLVSVVLMAGCAGLTSEEPTGMTLEDAAEVLDLSSVLPPGFAKLDEWQALSMGVTKESLGLGADASDLQIFASDSPPQFVYCFIRIIENWTAQRNAATELLDDSGVRRVTETLLDFWLAQAGTDRSELPELEIVVSHPGIGVEAALAEGGAETQDGAGGFELLSFRSEDKRVFVFVHSWHMSEGHVSVVSLGGEIEDRVMAFIE